MALTKLGCGGQIGALPLPSTIFSNGKCKACALCIATSKTLATTCTPPAKLEVGVTIIVNLEGSIWQAAATFSIIANGGIASFSITNAVVSNLSA